MDRWEYRTVLLWADIDNNGAREYIKDTWPKWQPSKYSPETLIPVLNEYGESGWELVNLEPVFIGKNHDVLMHDNGTGLWTRVYLCAFKRKKQD